MKRVITAMMMSVFSPQLLVLAAAGADDVDERELQELLRPFYLNEAAGYELFLDETRETQLSLVEHPIMSWTGRENGVSSGDVFVWTHRGRAEVVGCIGSLPRANNSRLIFHEFRALTKAPLPAINVGRELWSPKKLGVDSHLIIDAPLPASRSSQRLVQMRALARQFDIQMQTPSGDKTRLRMLPRPIVRNSAKDGDTSDGALFAFVWDVGTDPECLLLLESLPTDGGRRWHYAPASFNYRELWLNHRDVEVWKAIRRGGSKAEPYVSIGTDVKTVQTIRDEIKRRSPPVESNAIAKPTPE